MSDYPSWTDEHQGLNDSHNMNWSSPTSEKPPYGYGNSGGNTYSQSAPYSGGGYSGYSSNNEMGTGYDSGGYNSDRPRFSEDGRGQPYSSLLAKVGAAAKNQDISYDTSSRDPALLRSRVFIGNIGRGPIVREDIIELCRPFGSLLAVTLFKGYAFVQFSDAADADVACDALNAKRWKGVNIDVHLAMEGLVKKAIPQKRGPEPPAPFGGRVGKGKPGGPPGGGDTYGGGNSKRPRTVNSGADEEPYIEVNDQNRRDAADDKTIVNELVSAEFADTLICGTCRFVTADFVAFREHRKRPCTKPKDALEPPVLKCASCGLRFLTAWKMLFHLTDFHRMQLFKPDYTAEAAEKAKGEEDKYKRVQEERMHEFRAENLKRQEQEPFDPTADSDNATFSNGSHVPLVGQVGSMQVPPQSQTDKTSVNTPSERRTTGADYDEEEEDEDNDQPSTIPTIG